jgi:hypothetical protein
VRPASTLPIFYGIIGIKVACTGDRKMKKHTSALRYPEQAHVKSWLTMSVQASWTLSIRTFRHRPNRVVGRGLCRA